MPYLMNILLYVIYSYDITYIIIYYIISKVLIYTQQKE